MSNISIYLNKEQQRKLDVLTSKGLAENINKKAESVEIERSRSAVIATIIEREYNKRIEAEMIADAVLIDRDNLGWSEEERQCQAID